MVLFWPFLKHMWALRDRRAFSFPSLSILTFPVVRFLLSRHVEVLKAWLASHKPLILCGPPGSGKTMTLTSTLQAMPNLVLASLNFSSSTDPNLILQVM